MNKKKYLKAKTYRLIDQLIAIKQRFPESDVTIKNGALHWSGYMKPTAVSRIYHVVIDYKVRKRPVVRLCGDNIQGLDRPNFPHKFHTDYEKKQVDLCLHLRYEFTSSMLIADTIIPWAIEWLYFYEIWLATDTWCGGGKHPEGKKNCGVTHEHNLKAAV
ncbi:MAG: hypothetical protein PHE47_04240 [Oscillospiraceae bacterium]|nr:hypothetical protein [Oscillospiraceae bacterium]